MIPSLNDLRLVGLEDLILHEAHDEDRLLRLRERIEDEGEQRNPVIVSSQDGCCLVLDGAHRVRALQELGCSLALVQLVEPPETAESWAHLIEGADLPQLRSIERDRALREAAQQAPRRAGDRWGREGLSPLPQRRASGGGAGLWACRRSIPKGWWCGASSQTAPVKLAEGETIIRYRPFTPGELSRDRALRSVLPAGITRFRLKERVLGVRYPLTKMKNGNAPTRNAELKAFVERLWRENRIRYYKEPVVLFE